MAANLIASGQHQIAVYDIDKSKAQSLLELGATWIDDIPVTLNVADVVMTSLPGPVQINAFAFGNDADAKGALEHMQAGSTWIDLSTNNLSTCQQILTAANKKSIQFLDSPVSGGDEGARAGNLTMLVGGDQAVFEQHQDLLELLGSNISHLGQSGAGYAAKISQVILCYLHSVALSEALMLGIKAGVDAEKMLGIIQNSTGRSYVADRYGPPILDGDYDPSFALGLALKDMRLAMELADTLELELPMCDMVTQTYDRACEQYGFDANHLIAVRLLEEDNGTFLRRHSK